MLVVVVIGLSLLAFRMWYLQIIKGEDMRQKAESNSIRLKKIVPIRGVVMDTNREILADSQCSFDINFTPTRNRDIQTVADRFSFLYGQAALQFNQEVFAPGRMKPFVPVKLDKNVSGEKLAIVETHALDLPGVGVVVVPIRRYMAGEMMAHIIGYTGEVSAEELDRAEADSLTSGDIIGKSGIEKYLDSHLRGVSGNEQVEVNVRGMETRILGREDPKPGNNVVLTIDILLQKAAWEAMSGKPGAVVAIDPRDGSVLAMVSSPSFDPAQFSGGISQRNWKKLAHDPLHPLENRAIAGQYPPASTYKVFVAAAALQEGLITPETSFNCDGAYELGNRKFRCWQKSGHGRVSLHRAIVQSCDVYFYHVGKLLGVDTLAQYSGYFGLGTRTGIALPREKAGLIPTRAWKQQARKEPWHLGETISVSIGQGYNLVTPLQLVTAYGALANGGVVWEPRLIKRIETVDGQVIEEFLPVVKSMLPFRSDIIEVLKKAHWGVVNEDGGTGRAVRRKDTDVAGKTGTAQVVGLPDNEKARKKVMSLRFQDHALFVCFAPVNNPEIAVAVIAENAGSGGSVAAPIAARVLDAYFELKKSREKKQFAASEDNRDKDKLKVHN